MKILSLDIQKNTLETLDISGFFSISEVHAIYNGTLKPTLDQILPELPNISLARNVELEVEPFETFPTLDIVHSDLIQSSFWQKKYPELHNRKQKIILAEPLREPFGAIDMRTLSPIHSEKKYADLFSRELSFPLKVKKFFKKSRFFFRRNKKTLSWGFATFFLFVVPMLFFIKFSVENGYNRLLTLKDAQNISQVKRIIQDSRSDFERAEFLFLPFSWIPLDTVDLVNRATSGGKKLTTSLDTVLDLIPESENNFSLKVVENGESSAFRGASKDVFPLENLGVTLPTNLLKEHKNEIFSAIADLESAGEIYQNAKGNSSYAHKIRQVWNILTSIKPLLDGYKDNQDVILKMLGDKEPHRYIVFNQNRDEIRANGGFPGSIISFTLYKGNILDYRTDDVYYYDWNLYPHKETPPPGLALLSNNYWLRDVNYYPDFRQTLEKANSFVEKSGDSTLTTAIAIHQWLVEDILAEIGEVKLEGVDIPFTADNFSILMSVLVENKFAKEKTPKDILFKFISAFGKQIVESRKIENVAKIIENNWKNGEILMASRNDEVQKFLESIQKPLPWKVDSKNWIYPVFTSVSGNKSDRYIDRSLEVKSKLIEACTYETTATLIQEHTYTQEDKQALENLMNTFGLENTAEREKMSFIQWNGLNKSFVRYYVPKWSLLVGSGAEISEEESATIFSFMIETPVGGKAEKTLTYRQNIDNCSDYNKEIPVFHQPGLRTFLIP